MLASLTSNAAGSNTLVAHPLRLDQGVKDAQRPIVEPLVVEMLKSLPSTRTLAPAVEACATVRDNKCRGGVEARET